MRECLLEKPGHLKYHHDTNCLRKPLPCVVGSLTPGPMLFCLTLQHRFRVFLCVDSFPLLIPVARRSFFVHKLLKEGNSALVGVSVHFSVVDVLLMSLSVPSMSSTVVNICFKSGVGFLNFFPSVFYMPHLLRVVIFTMESQQGVT